MFLHVRINLFAAPVGQWVYFYQTRLVFLKNSDVFTTAPLAASQAGDPASNPFQGLFHKRDFGVIAANTGPIVARIEEFLGHTFLSGVRAERFEVQMEFFL